MDSKIFNNIMREYQKIRDARKRELEYRKETVYQKIPQIKRIDDQIAALSISISRALIVGQGDSTELLEKIKKDLEELKRDKAILLTEHNLSASFLEMEYDCPACKDSGFLTDNGKCPCLKQKLINHYYRMSNLSNSFLKENFQTFNINLFSDRPFESEGISPRDNMLNILNNCEGFVIDFDNHSENLLFLGTTGLGKTFMCNCIAKALLDKGKVIIYQTAFRIVEILEKYKFDRDNEKFDSNQYDMLFDCDLLIIDDLGTELANSFTNSEIFNVINTRLISNKKTIISTNLSLAELSQVYTDRISSRLFGNFTILKFFGPDLRWENKTR